ncbi:hypothetical protein Nepgr_012462 [Nepenthes gracilis]|uniref:Uncharacterized protein n=1 Tax=Nepenthes gracilis TaxID=150966 RepID=A0AAD3XNC8_NEPGR|nr:hypothetical protein Nepgr_012462 [Nepenthes gracilis]
MHSGFINSRPPCQRNSTPHAKPLASSHDGHSSNESTKTPGSSLKATHHEAIRITGVQDATRHTDSKRNLQEEPANNTPSSDFAAREGFSTPLWPFPLTV